MSNNKRFRMAGIAVAIILAIIALVSYLGATGNSPSFGPFDRSAYNLSQHMEFTPFGVLTNPIWGAVLRSCTPTLFDSPAGGASALSAIFGALVILMLCLLVRKGIVLLTDHEDRDGTPTQLAAVLASVTAGLFLAFSLPFSYVASRIYPTTFDLFLLLAASHLFLMHLRSGKPGWLWGFALLYGIGAVEFATFIVFTPFFGIALIIYCMKEGSFRVSALLPAFLFFLLGLTLYIAFAVRFTNSPAFAYTTYESFWQVVRHALVGQYHLIAHSLPPTGWIVVVLLTIGPWLAAMVVGHRALGGEPQWGYVGLHAVMTVMTFIVLFNLEMSPWILVGRQSLLVTPYVLAAWVFGYLTAYWFLLPLKLNTSLARSLKVWVKRTAATLLVIPFVISPIVAATRNAEEAPSHNEFVAGYVSEIFDSLEGRDTLLTSGIFDGHIYVEADKRGTPITVIDLSRSGGSSAYTAYIASLFDSPRMQSLARVGLTPLIREWAESDAEMTKKVAILAKPDAWIAAGLSPVPNKTLFFGSRDAAAIDMNTIVDNHRSFWPRAIALIPDAPSPEEGDTSEPAEIARFLRTRTSLVANNLGVMLQEHGDDEHALEVYEEAIEIYPYNISTLLNLAALARTDGDNQGLQSAIEEIEALLALSERPPAMSTLSRQYGYVWTPQAFGELGWSWAMSGNKNVSISSLTKAVDLAGDHAAPIQQFLAGLLQEYGDTAESEAIYRDILAKQPNNRAAMISLAHVLAQGGKLKDAATMLDQAESSGVPADRILFEKAVLEVIGGNSSRAREVLETLINENPSSSKAISLLTYLAIEDGDEEAIKRCSRLLDRLSTKKDLSVILALAQLATARGDFPLARRHYTEALTIRPATVTILEQLLQIDVRETDQTQASKHIRQILSIDPRNALGNWVLASFLVASEDYVPAEDCLRISIDSMESPQALSDLAWVLHFQERDDEALAVATKSLRLSKSAAQWDTLGVILTSLERYGRAEQAFDKALAQSDDVHISVHKAAMLIENGQNDAARDILEALMMIESDLSDETKLEIIELSDKIPSE